MKRKPIDSHPVDLALLYYAQLRLPLVQHFVIESHLKACAGCRRRCAEMGSSGFPPPETPPPLPEISAAMRRREAERLQSVKPSLGLDRAAREIGKCLGAQAAATLMAGVSCEGDRLARVQPVLALFLGRRAAGRLSSRIAETAPVGS